MFKVPTRLCAAIEARIQHMPVNPKLLLVAGEVSFEILHLPAGILMVFEKDHKDAWLLQISAELSEKETKQMEAQAVAILLLHGQKFTKGDACILRKHSQNGVFGRREILDAKDIQQAGLMALELLIPTVALRQQFLYTRGDLNKMAKTFDVPKSLIHAACVRHGLLDARVKTA